MKLKKPALPNMKDSNKEKKSLPALDMQKALEKGSSALSEGVSAAKHGVVVAKQGVIKVADVVGEKSRDVQMVVLTYVDKKKNARFLKAKLSAFEDGLKAGKLQTVDYIKKYANFCLASTALSFYFARCDGTIDETEQLEIEHDLDSIIKNRDIPESLRNKLAEISLKENLTFKEVSYYLDGVGIETLLEFSNDIDEIIMADENITIEEERAKAEFEVYLAKRMEAEKYE